MPDEVPRYTAWDRLLFFAAERFGVAGLRTLSATWRCRIGGVASYEAGLRADGRVIAAFWHAFLLAPIGRFRRRGVRILSGLHRDAEIMARVESRLGFHPLRGSSTRGGAEALRGLVEEAANPFPIAMTPDGPKGPRERVKPGTILLAKLTGRPIVPVGFAVDRAWRIASWDRFAIPKPFARIVIAFGDWIRVPADADKEALDPWCEALEAAIHRATGEAESLLDRGPGAA